MESKKTLFMGAGENSLDVAWRLLKELYICLDGTDALNSPETYQSEDLIKLISEALTGQTVELRKKLAPKSLQHELTQKGYNCAKFDFVHIFMSLMHELGGLQQGGIGPDPVSEEAQQLQWDYYEQRVDRFLAHLAVFLTGRTTK
jgi:hypothetical protein